MKRCPECRRDYFDETLLYCLDDGSALLEGPVSDNEPPTEVLEKPTLQMSRSDEKPVKIYTRSRILWWFVGGVLVFGGFLVVALVIQSSKSQTKNAENISLTPLTNDPGYEGEPTFSADGETIAYVSDRTGNFEI